MNLRILQELMNEVNGNSIISIDTLTDVTVKGGKKNPFLGRVTKRTTGSSVMVFQNKNVNGYENMVKRRLQKEGKNPETFVLGPRQWGTRVPGTPFVEHNGQTYLEVIYLRRGNVEYLVDGQQYKGDIEGLPPDPEEADQGGLSNKVVIRSYNIASLRAITINGQRFEDHR
jgi:hypothetical protein